MKLEFLPIRTRIVRPPQDDISDIIDSLDVKNGDIIFITSKILGLYQGRTAKIGTVAKEDLIKQEANRYLEYVNAAGDFHVNLTVTQNILIPAAGIDESNADGYYVMWPQNIDSLCHEIRKQLMKKHNLTKLGVIATDSHTTPLRWGVTGITIGLAGVEPLRDIRGEPDLFGRLMHVTKVDLIDPLASMAVLLMGESNESTPIVILRGYTGIPFSDAASMAEFKIDPSLDLYSPLISVLPETDASGKTS
ncbi:coenzyme F420-0:L-glutamate ligase [Candidatus Saccharibacteria bacterium]|nr:coenzyme F420-0:L-glutamate ligase [Candidatus Saccharibacteria bacterium]MBQ6375600.1 coenzyme F420-0:L-glutamate ligase [Candidatus Saccharibacteria bacterium]